MSHVIRTIKRPNGSLVSKIANYPPATLHEAQGRRGALDWRIKPIYSGMKCCGPAVTVQCHPGDNIMLFAAISVAEPGDVLVASFGENSEQGGFGEVLTTWCQARGIVALVTSGGVRDGLAIRDKGFPVFCPGLSVKGTVKETLGNVNHPIVLGGVWIHPGDIVSGDDDGVVVVRPEEAEVVAEKSQVREDKEAELMRALAEGANGLDLLGMGEVLDAKGCTFSD